MSKLDNLTTMAHKLQAMRLIDPAMTRGEALAIILKNSHVPGEDPRSAMAFERYVQRKIDELWDQPLEASPTN